MSDQKLVITQKSSGQYWTGCGWTSDAAQAMVYTQWSEAMAASPPKIRVVIKSKTRENEN